MIKHLDESKYLPYVKTIPGLRDIAEYVDNVIAEADSGTTIYANFGNDKIKFGYRFNYTKVEVTQDGDCPDMSIIVDRPEYLIVIDLGKGYITFSNNDGDMTKTTIRHDGKLKEFLIDVAEKLQKVHQSKKD